ncbi:sigma-54-dependent Fis family transcriptional regulator [Ideonella sp. 4Y16]|uniref:Sigma-54-dependent Fis family transcriptional regulator n=1 Tax=Ideonella alba TaxID=2824118 RepID=A0A940YCD5_9BURK|nr:sigma-54-dependent Fis family transcriptional regulator [Ideonella alba]MBQ0932998.1 sigma-54-dependent Fis family transcriptional regulator [Ideonella alba]MBQ0945757.1 sigma-54-dependent Fis family transcriptional regulator [Ideonella alba]
MHATQREHIATVMEVAGHGVHARAAQHHEQIIRDSWHRCVHQHGLDPTRMQEAVILPQSQLRQHQDQMEAFLHIARHGLETLYQHVAGLGYVVLLTDARGVTVDFIGDLQIEPSLRKAGLYLGADWSEHHAGTCGVGTCISTGEALTVHLDDHFDATHIPLTCTTSPVYDASGRLTAVLDISALRSPDPKGSQALALQLVKLYAQHIENANFLYRFSRDWVLRLSTAPQFLDVNPEYLIALDASGRVIGHNRRAQHALQIDARQPLVGQAFDTLFEARFEDIGRFVMAQPSDQRAVMRAGGRELLFLSATPPPPRPPLTPGQPERPVPAPLAALNLGDPALARQIERAARLVNSPVSLLITGETGSGKEYFAKAVHASSERRARPFVAVNCAAIPETLIESELFGHLPGSFSGAATKGKRGLVQEADGGTLFLDEIGDMPLALQARLLRVLSEREVLPVGATRPVAVNIRVIAATHAPLEDLVRAGRFRDDLYYRINGAHISLPPLRERRDLAALIQRLLQGRALAADALARLLAYRWPGNLRELKNVLDCATSVASPHGPIGLTDLPELPGLGTADRTPAPSPAPATSGGPLLAELQAAHWNITLAARRLGVARMTLYRRMKRAGIVPPNQRD